MSSLNPMALPLSYPVAPAPLTDKALRTTFGGLVAPCQTPRRVWHFEQELARFAVAAPALIKRGRPLAGLRRGRPPAAEGVSEEQSVRGIGKGEGRTANREPRTANIGPPSLRLSTVPPGAEGERKPSAPSTRDFDFYLRDPR